MPRLSNRAYFGGSGWKCDGAITTIGMQNVNINMPGSFLEEVLHEPKYLDDQPNVGRVMNRNNKPAC